MDRSNGLQGSLGWQPRLFDVLASLAVLVSVITILSQLAVVAAPLWKGGPVRDTLIDTGSHFVLSVPVMFYVAGLYYARRVFRRMGTGQLFVPENGRGVLALGRCLLLGATWAVCVAGLEPYSPDQPIAVTMQQVQASAAELVLAALGLGLMMIGQVMKKAVALKAENDAFV